MTKKRTSTPGDVWTAAMPRRQWLKATGLMALGAGALGAPAALAAPAEDRRAKAKKNLRLGIHTAPYAAMPVEEAARRIHADGFRSVLTDFAFADVRFDPAAPDWDAAKKITAALDRNEVRIAAIFGYYNVVDPVPERRKRGEDRMRFFIANWKRLGCPNISTETGTLNAESEWLESPKNATEEAFVQCRDALASLAAEAEKAGAMISIEPYWRNVIDSIDRADRLFREVKSPGLKLVMDPCNFFRKDDFPRMAPMLRDMFRRLGDRIAVAHAKDVKPLAEGTDLPAAGLGVLDYPLYLRLLAGLDREMDLIVEHLGIDDVVRARDYVLGQIERI